MKEYLFYIRKYSIFTNDYKMCVYRCKTDDPYHTMGEIHYRTIEAINYSTFVECTQAKLDYWKECKIEIIDWYNKYPYSTYKLDKLKEWLLSMRDRAEKLPESEFQKGGYTILNDIIRQVLNIEQGEKL